MIKIKIKEIAKERGIKNAHRLQLAAGLSPAAASRFWKSEIEKISMETLDRLCRFLECQPGDLFVYTAEKSSKAANHGKTVTADVKKSKKTNRR
jgi:putative transcriptional regulator